MASSLGIWEAKIMKRAQPGCASSGTIYLDWLYRKDRKKVEMLFAHLKRILRLDRVRLRGLRGAQDEFVLAATAQTLRRMAQWLM